MKININYGSEAVVMPGAVFSKLDKATKRDLRVLFLLCSSPEMRSDKEKLAIAAVCTEAELSASLSFWDGAGIIDVFDGNDTKPSKQTVPSDSEKSDKKSAKSAKKLELPDELPSYSTSELNSILQGHSDSVIMIEECQNVFGKMFNPHEISTLIGIKDYFNLESEYIITLLIHCAKINKKSMHYIKKLAFSLYDQGITEANALNEHFKEVEAILSVEGEIRSIFGMKNRELSSKEKKFINTWVGKYGYGVDVIKKAYEMTVDAIHEPSPAYANAIIERWHKDGLNDLAAIEAAEADKLPVDGSFDTNDFFEAALKRSFNDTDNK